MSWGMVAGAVIGGAVSYVGQKDANKQAGKAAKNAGYVDTTTTRKGDPYADPYRQGALDAAWGALTGTAPLSGKPGVPIKGDPNAAPSGTGRPAPPPGMRYNKAGKLVKPKNAAPAGTTTPPTASTPTARNFDGMSGETDEIRRRAMDDLPKANEDLFGAGQGFVKDTLAGDSRNPLIGRASEAADDISDDPRLASFQDALLSDLGIGSASTEGGARPDRKVHAGTVARAYGGGGGYAPQASGYGAPGGGSGWTTPELTGAAGELKKAMAGEAPQGEWAKSSGADDAIAKILKGEAIPGAANADATGARSALAKLIAGESPAGWAAAEEAITRRVNESRAANIRELKARGVGSGFYGGSLYKDLETGAIAKGDQELADSLAAKRYEAYRDAVGMGAEYDQSEAARAQEAYLTALQTGNERDIARERARLETLGLGSQFDIDALGLANERDLGFADIAANERSSTAASSAAGAAAGADIASREKLAKYGFALDALDLGEKGRFGRAGALGDLAGLVSSDQQGALKSVNDITGGRRADLGLAGDVSLGADSNRNSFRASNNQLAGVRAGVNLGRAELAFDRERFYDPFSRLGQFADIQNSLYGGYGSETTTGRDTRAGGGAGYSSPWGAAMTGAALGGQIGSAYGRNRQPQPSGSFSYGITPQGTNWG